MLAQLDERLETLRREAQQAEEEAAKLRPRLQYLQEMLLRLEGAIVALAQLRDALTHVESPPPELSPQLRAEVNAHLRADIPASSAYQPVAP
jgi:chromosome segregation ATPase